MNEILIKFDSVFKLLGGLGKNFRVTLGDFLLILELLGGLGKNYLVRGPGRILGGTSGFWFSFLVFISGFHFWFPNPDRT